VGRPQVLRKPWIPRELWKSQKSRKLLPAALIGKLALMTACSRVKAGDTPGADDARAAYRAIVRESPGPVKLPDPPAWLSNFLAAAGAWLDRNRLGIVLIGAGLLAGTLLIAIVTGIRRRARRLSSGLGEGSRPTVRVTSAVSPSIDLLARADALAEGGDYSSAILLLHLAMLRGLCERGILDARRSYGNREVRSILECGAGGAEAFAMVAASAEGVAFGRRSLGRTEWEEARSVWTGFLGAVA
jgi:hypothetical protein